MKTILITGASSGIGAATARQFLAAGWHVGLMARRRAPLEALAAGQAATALPADVTDPAQVTAAFDTLQAATGSVDVLFNNAGMFGAQAEPDALEIDVWRQVVEVNLNGMFYCAREAFGRMKAAGGGRIINNGSISAHVPREGSIAYTATKHAVTGLTRSLSLDGRPHNVACGQIDIGNAETEMVADLQERLAAAGKPLNPTMAVADAAKAVLSMAELPLAANVQFMTIMATQMAYIGRG